jgi:hypothetical protein
MTIRFYRACEQQQHAATVTATSSPLCFHHHGHITTFVLPPSQPHHLHAATITATSLPSSCHYHNDSSPPSPILPPPHLLCGHVTARDRQYGNTHGVPKTDCAGTGRVCEMPTCGFTVPVTVVLWVCTVFNILVPRVLHGYGTGRQFPHHTRTREHRTRHGYGYLTTRN